MKIMPGSRRYHYAARVSVFLVTAALIAGMVGCDGGGGDYNPPPSQNLEIRTWYDLAAVRNNLAGNHTLMNDLDSTTLGYDELAGPTANGGKGWQPIGCFRTAGTTGLGYVSGMDVAPWYDFLTGTFDGQGYEIRDLFINRPDESNVGLFGGVLYDGVIKNISVVKATVTGDKYVGSLVGYSWSGSTVSNSYSSANVTGELWVGGLVGLNEGGTVSNSYSSGNVTGGRYPVGGLVGRNEGTVINSYSTGSVTGASFVGGLVGDNSGTISNSYSAGSVTGTYNHVGGLVGASSGTVSNSFWDLQTSGQPTSSGGTGENTTEMQDINTFSGATWNITTVGGIGERNTTYIWNIVNNVTYPFLSWQS